jgi:hypothetical protein
MKTKTNFVKCLISLFLTRRTIQEPKYKTANILKLDHDLNYFICSARKSDPYITNTGTNRQPCLALYSETKPKFYTNRKCTKHTV